MIIHIYILPSLKWALMLLQLLLLQLLFATSWHAASTSRFLLPVRHLGKKYNNIWANRDWFYNQKYSIIVWYVNFKHSDWLDTFQQTNRNAQGQKTLGISWVVVVLGFFVYLCVIYYHHWAIFIFDHYLSLNLSRAILYITICICQSIIYCRRPVGQYWSCFDCG